VAEALEDVAPQVEEEDGQWYLGRAKEEFQRRRRNRNAAQPQGQDEDLLEVWDIFSFQALGVLLTSFVSFFLSFFISFFRSG